MKAVHLVQPGQFELIEQSSPHLEPGMALVRVHRVGICGTDIHAFHGRQPFFDYPRILGHELGVEVLEVHPESPGAKVNAGDRCAVEPYLNDPASPASRRGRSNCCQELKVLGVHVDGGMRPQIVVPVEKLHASKALSFDQLSLVETLCIGAHGVERSGAKNGDAVLIVGGGPIGLGAAQSAMARGCRVAIADVSDSRLSFAREVGILDTFDPSQIEMETALLDWGKGELPQVVIDATGSKMAMEKSFRLVGHGGALVFLGLTMGQIEFSNPDFHRKELSLHASRNATPETFAWVMEQLSRGAMSVDSWVTHRLALDDLPTHFERVTSDEALVKAIVSL